MKKRTVFMAMLLTMAGSHMAYADDGVINASSLRVRQKASLSSSTISSLPRNTKITTLGKEGDFYKINYKGQTGYVYSSYVKITSGSAGTSPAGISGTVTTQHLNVRSGSGITYRVADVIILGTKVTMYQKLNGFYKINYGGKIGYVSEQYVKATGESGTGSVTPPESPSTGIGTITASVLNVRKSASMGNNVIGSISLNGKVDLYGIQNGFYKIKYNGKIGYVSEQYVKATGESGTGSVTPPESPSTGIGTITASTLNVRKSASIGNNVIGSISLNGRVDLYGIQNGFYKIKYNGQWGYVSKSYVSLNNAPANNTNYTANGQQYVATKSINSLMSYLNTFLGTPYLWGGTTPARFNSAHRYIGGGFDCSGLIQYSYKYLGINLPRVTMDQINKGASVNMNNLQKGDLVFFRTNAAVPSQASHAGIYVGNNKFIQSPKTGDVVKISELTGYYKDKFIIGKRIIK